MKVNEQIISSEKYHMLWDIHLKQFKLITMKGLNRVFMDFLLIVFAIQVFYKPIQNVTILVLSKILKSRIKIISHLSQFMLQHF